MKKMQFIVNPISGVNRNPQKIVRWIEKYFGSQGENVQIVYTQNAGDGERLSRQALENGCEMVVAVGGDGTINEVASALVNQSACLGIVPAGSGNGFARNFNIPLDQRKAIKQLQNHREISIDVGKINERYFFNVAGIGLDAEISHQFEQFGVRGPLPYFLVGAKSFLQYKTTPVTIITPEKEFQSSPLLISIANAPQYGNGAIIAPGAVPDDGLLDICILDQIPVWKAAPNLYRLFNGTIDNMNGFISFQSASVLIRRSDSGPIHVDGNPFEEVKDLEIKVLPRALKIAVAG